MENIKIVTGVGASTTLLASPVADALAGTIYSDVVDMSGFNECTFMIIRGVGATGTSTVTIEGCDDFAPSNTEAVAFEYAHVATNETNGAWVQATTAGFETTAGSHGITMVRVKGDNLTSDYPKVRLKAVEATNSPVLASCIIMLTEPRYDKSVPDAVTA